MVSWDTISVISMHSGPTTHSFMSQRLRLRYVDWGNPAAPPLILLHGGRDHSRSWDWVAQALRSDWHVIAPDLRGHGDSDWSNTGDYSALANLYDLAQLIHQRRLAPVTIVGHSYGGHLSLRYAAIYPDNVRKLVAIEGLGPSPESFRKRAAVPIDKRIRDWIDARRAVSGRVARRYPTLEDAYERMREANHHLTEEQAHHLTVHGISQNEDGTYSWKFDNTVHVFPPFDLSADQLAQLWQRITCPTLLMVGKNSWASNPAEDGRAENFSNAKVIAYDDAGHWLHHDRFEEFVADLKNFL